MYNSIYIVVYVLVRLDVYLFQELQLVWQRSTHSVLLPGMARVPAWRLFLLTLQKTVRVFWNQPFVILILVCLIIIVSWINIIYLVFIFSIAQIYNVSFIPEFSHRLLSLIWISLYFSCVSGKWDNV